MLFAIVLACATTGSPEPDASEAPPTPVEEPAQAEEPAPEEARIVLQEVPVGPVTAIFQGEAVPPGIRPAFGIRDIVFRLADGSEVPFVPAGTVEHSDWTFELGSPDGAHVLLVQDHYGPYHVVAVDQLGSYLAGTREPDHVLHQAQPVDAGAWIHENGRWTSASEVAYEAGLTTMETFTYPLP